MIALHFRDSPVHLIAPSQHAGFGIPESFGGSSFHGRDPLACLTVTINLRDLYRVRCYSLVDVIIVNVFCGFIQKQHKLRCSGAREKGMPLEENV